MPNFTPNSIIHIGRVPFDNSYAHTMTFASATAQANYFLSVCTQSLSRTDYTYVRMNNAIRVPFNAESLYTYNYVMYKNANYGDKWFYAFIVAVNYVNENMTELVLELDVMQTWYFDYDLAQCFVEREHVNDDTIGKHLNPEPSMELQYVHEHFTPVSLSAGYIVLLVNQVPTYHETSLPPVYNKPVGSKPISGGLYQRFVSGCKPVIFYNNANGLTAFRDFINALNSVGAADTIIDGYCVPTDSISVAELVSLECDVLYADGTSGTFALDNTYTLNDNAAPKATDIPYSKPTTLDGYTPHNNKLLTYPYSYLEIGDFSGRIQDYRWEYFTYDTSTIHLINKFNGISDCVGYVTPARYNGVNYNSSTPPENQYEMSTEPFTYAFNNKVSWVYGTYQNWSAQNAVGNQLAVLGGAITMLSAIPSGIDAFASVKNGRAFDSESYKKGDRALDRAGSRLLAGAGIIGSTVANIERMHRHPNIARGNTQGNSKYQTNFAGFYYSQMNLREEFARIIDGFFDMYGYQVDQVKIPNRTGRRNWNYVKTANADMHGNVPAEDMARINAIYNAGITFWHTSDIGNYSLANDIV